MAGLTENGLVIRTQPELQELLEEFVREAVPGIDLSQGPEHQFIGILSEELALTWETLQAVVAAHRGDGDGVLADAFAAITGTRRRAATRSLVIADLTLAPFTTLAAGSIAAVLGAPDSQFRTTDEVVNATGSAADVPAVLESVETGPVAAPAGTLTVIVTPSTGWSAITNAADAELGLERATDPELRAQRVVELAGAGTSPLDSTVAAVARVDGVIEVAVIENASLSTDGEGRPGKSFEVVVWDGTIPAADDDEIAAAIWGTKPQGIEVHGAGVDAGDVVLSTGATQTVPFTRAAEIELHVSATVVLAPGTGAAWETQAADAVSERGDEYTVGQTAYSSQLICALLEVPGVVAVTALTIGTAPAPVDAVVTAEYDEILRIPSANVSVVSA